VWISSVILFIKNEFKTLYRFLRGNRNEITVIAAALLFISLDYYHPVWKEWFSSLLYYAFLPILVIVLVLRRKISDFGFGTGNLRVWGFHVLIFCLVAFPILYFTRDSQAFRNYYRTGDFNAISYLLVTFVSLFASEFLFRGFLLFGLKDKLKDLSIPVQMIPFMLVHLGKPELETISTILTGIYFGYVCYRGKSFWPAFIMHMYINIYFVVSVNML
jgi:uncharacterized protein